MSLRRFIERDIVSCNPNANITTVAEKMKIEDVGAVVIVEQGRPIGIITDRDIVLRCLCSDCDCQTTSVSDVMTKQVSTVPESAGLYDVIACMSSEGVRRVVVVDNDRKAIGLFSFGDILALLAKEMNELSRNTSSSHTGFRKKIEKAA